MRSVLHKAKAVSNRLTGYIEELEKEIDNKTSQLDNAYRTINDIVKLNKTKDANYLEGLQYGVEAIEESITLKRKVIELENKIKIYEQYYDEELK